MALIELQLEGLPGPTSFHGGLSAGNRASEANAGATAHPRAAAQQVLALWRVLLGLGQQLAFLPPLPRPDLRLLRRLGFDGDDAQVLALARAAEPLLVAIAASSAFMWTANAATVIPASDSEDGRLHLVPANLIAMPHRAFEAEGRTRQLRRVFGDGEHVTIHEPLPASPTLGDEGAANHHRAEGPLGVVHLFVHGRAHDLPAQALPTSAPARQTREASAAVARLGRARQVLHARQHPRAIDAGAFHNDVVMVGTGNLLLAHELALVDQPAVLQELAARCGGLTACVVPDAELPLAEAVRSYLFNSLLLPTPQGMALVAPEEASQGRARQVVERLRAEGVVASVHFCPLRESMRGGGGPACLRLRVPLDEAALAHVDPAYRLDAARIDLLGEWVDAHYRETITPADLADPRLARESEAALEALTNRCGMGRLYRFQGGPV